MALFRPEYKQTCRSHVIPMQVSGGVLQRIVI